MKRIVVIATVVMALVAAASAFAASSINNYQASFKFSNKAGTAAKPVPAAFSFGLSVTPVTPGNRTGILHTIKATIYGLKFDGKAFPTCSATKISAAQNDTSCPKKALVATGYINATLGSPTDFTSPGAACGPALDVWNGGGNKLVFFFVVKPGHTCANLKTGSTPPYVATGTQAGKNFVLNVPVPNSVDYPAGGAVAGSLSTEVLNFKGQTSGKNISLASVGCQGSKRPYSVTVNATEPGLGTETKTVSGSSPC